MKQQQPAIAQQTLEQIQQVFTPLERRLDGETFYFLAANERADKVVILLHGVTGNKLDMVLVGQQLAAQGYAVYAPDLPGHGNAAPITAKTFDDFGRWFHACIESLGRSPALVMGNSFGTAVCYNYAQQGFLPAKAQLILGCPTPDISLASRVLRNAGRALPARIALKLYNSHLVIFLRVLYLHVSGKPEAKRWLEESEYFKRQFIDPNMPNSMSTLLEMQNPFHGPLLSLALQDRVTYIVGDRDNVATRSTLATMARVLPEAHRRIIPGVGHILHFDAWEECAAIALDRLKHQ